MSIMQRDYILEALRRCNRNLFLVNGVALLFLLFIGYSANWNILEYPAVIVITAFVLWYLLKVIRRQLDPSSHPIYRKLNTDSFPQNVISEINRELNMKDIFHYNSITITPNWLLNESLFSIRIVRLAEIVWVYKAKTDYYLRAGFFKFKHDETTEVCITFNDGTKIKINGGKLATKIINEITSKVPWITVGYSDELKMLWTRDRDVMIAAVKQKKENIQHNLY